MYTSSHRFWEHTAVVFFDMIITLPPTKYRNPKTDKELIVTLISVTICSLIFFICTAWSVCRQVYSNGKTKLVVWIIYANIDQALILSLPVSSIFTRKFSKKSTEEKSWTVKHISKPIWIGDTLVTQIAHYQRCWGQFWWILERGGCPSNTLWAL